MKMIETAIPGLKIIEPHIFQDNRGFFYESFNQKAFDTAIGHHVNFAQDNHSKSMQSVLRGLHLQQEPHAQGKLIRVIAGEVFDVAVDLRRESSTFGQWHGEYLSGQNNRQIWIPAGFAHGFLVISETAEFLYKTTNYWHPEQEVTIRWDDPLLAIKWPKLPTPYILSEKDKQGIHFGQYINSQ